MNMKTCCITTDGKIIFADDGGRDGMSIPTGSRSHEVEMKICNLMLTVIINVEFKFQTGQVVNCG